MVRSIEKSVMRSMVRPIDKKIDQKPGNLGTSPPSETGPEPGTGNPGTRNREPGNPGTQPATKIGGELSPNPSTSARTPSVQAPTGE
eukprot:8649857-Pyramimonas_sp.AAC.1